MSSVFCDKPKATMLWYNTPLLFTSGSYTAKSYFLNQNWNQSDPARSVPRTTTGLILNSKSGSVSVLQLCISSTRTVLRHAIHTGLIQICAY